MFAATTCPGPYLQSKFPYIADEVTRRLTGEIKTAVIKPEPPPPVAVQIYRVRVSSDDGKSQIGAFSSLQNAKLEADNNKALGYKVFDENKNLVYDPNASAINDPVPELTAITGQSVATAAQMTAYLDKINPGAPDLAAIYIEEGVAENIRGDVAFAQACLETGHFKFGGDVKPEQNNYAGIGAVGGGASGNSFETPRLGVRAQIQHLKAYVNNEPLAGECADPRFKYVERGVAPYVEWLGQKENPQGKGWATGRDYGAKILYVLRAILAVEIKIPVTKTPEEITVDNAIAAGVITDRDHWLGVLNGTVAPNRANIKLLMDKIINNKS